MITPAEEIREIGVRAYGDKKMVAKQFMFALTCACRNVQFMAGYHCGIAEDIALRGVGIPFGERAIKITRAIMQHMMWHQKRLK